jgi:N-hydroxyarylamine O-acetyltransferase
MWTSRATWPRASRSNSQGEGRGASVNLSAYLERIAYDGPRAASHDALARVAYRHALSIPFENLDPLLGIRPSLDPEAVAEKLVTRRRGGWCFEHNLLLGNALREMGFEVCDLAGRVVWRREPDAVAARTHRVLQVRCDGRDWLVDAGFGGQTLTGVLELDRDAEQVTPHGPFRLRRLGGERLLETRVREEWLPMYRFDLQPQLPVDFEAANFQLAHDPGSHFVNELIAALPTPEGRNTLRNGELAWNDMQGSSRRRQLGSAAEAMTALRDVFGIELASP